MDKGYFTVERISEMLNIHPKTIQRYIREGKLRAVKVGKSWRVSEHDLSVFVDGNNDVKVKPKTTASLVIDISTNDAEDAMRVMNALTAAFNGKPAEFSKTYMQSQYIQHENIVRITTWGDIHFISAVVNMLSEIIE